MHVVLQAMVLYACIWSCNPACMVLHVYGPLCMYKVLHVYGPVRIDKYDLACTWSSMHAYDPQCMMMMIGLKPGPRARTVKPGLRHLRTRPDPGQNRLGPHKGIPSGEARQCTPAGTEAVISALAPTAPPPIKAAQNATTVDTRSKTV